MEHAMTKTLPVSVRALRIVSFLQIVLAIVAFVMGAFIVISQLQRWAGPTGAIDFGLLPIIFFNYDVDYLMYACGILLLPGIFGVLTSSALAAGESRAMGIGICNCVVLVLNGVFCCVMMLRAPILFAYYACFFGACSILSIVSLVLWNKALSHFPDDDEEDEAGQSGRD